jgi:peptidoglycan/LPS O-acetylase OafA/YrhL
MQRHRVDIDGLRTLAIIPVVLFHMGFGFVPAGFLGVDVFFVISGYLITGILVNELELSGRINLIKFYERRIRRILPGFLVVLIFTFVAGWYFLLPNEFNALKQSTRFSLMSLSNVYFLGATNYFSPDTSTLPLIHTWSLSVEEQFYVIFPVFLLVTFKFVPRRAISYVLAGIFLASLSILLHNQVKPSISFNSGRGSC